MKELLEVPKVKYIPNVLRPSDVEGIPVDPILLAQIPSLMTPQQLLELTEFGNPQVITPDLYPNFETLVADREKVRVLGLLPIKTEYEYQRYKMQPRDQLLERVKGYLGDESIALAPNVFPYALPADLRQYLVWVRDHDVAEVAVNEFIAKAMTVHSLTPRDLILFERSTRTRARIVRGTFPEYRHIHFWSRLTG